MDEKTAAILEKLADKLGVGAEYLWGALLRQAPISSYLGAIGLCVVFIVSCVGLYIGCRSFEDGEPKDTKGFIWMIVGIIAALVFLVASAEFLSMIVAGFVNPEYWALMKLSRMF